MKPPAKVRVSPFTYDIRADSEACVIAGVVGGCLRDAQTILYDDRCAPTMIQDTVLHELLHAIWAQTDLARKYVDAGPGSKGEAIISQLAPRLLALLRDNPKLTAYLTAP